MRELTIGVIGTSRKTDEKRYPIHPAHLMRIPEKLRKKMIFEQGYSAAFNMNDEEIAALTGGIATRSDILTQLGTVIIAKPVLADLQELKEGGTIWGYVHCVQQQAITQAALDRKLTLIAFEDMFVWSPQGNVGRHTFYKNNEMAGYCAVLHALQLKGIEGEARMIVVEHDGSQRPLTELISEADIIVNGTYQETANPVNFVIESEADCLKPNSLIIDVSCDEGMGFFFAKPTTFKHPMFSYKTTDYYAVDHTPSYLWESATRSISAALIVYLPTVLSGPEQWQKDETIRRAINIEHGIIKNNAILAFQNRESAPPYHLQIADIT